MLTKRKYTDHEVKMEWRGGKGRENGWEGDLGEGINEFSFFSKALD